MVLLVLESSVSCSFFVLWDPHSNFYLCNIIEFEIKTKEKEQWIKTNKEIKRNPKF